MAADPEPYREAFSATAGVIRDFRWKVSGPSDQTDDIGTGFWGGPLALVKTFTDTVVAVDRAAQVGISLVVPDGPFTGGSTGKTITRVASLNRGLQDSAAG